MSTPDVQDELISVFQQLRDVRAMRDDLLRKVKEEYEPKIVELERTLQSHFAQLGYVLAPAGERAPAPPPAPAPSPAPPPRVQQARPAPSPPSKAKRAPSAAAPAQQPGRLEEILREKGVISLRDLAMEVYGADDQAARTRTSVRLTNLLKQGRVDKLGGGKWGWIGSAE